MNTILDSLRLPARLRVEQVAELLGFANHDIPVLIRKGLLHPLAKNAPPNSVKWLAAVDIEELAKNRAWLSKASTTISNHWSEANQARHPDNRIERVEAPADEEKYKSN